MELKTWAWCDCSSHADIYYSGHWYFGPSFFIFWPNFVPQTCKGATSFKSRGKHLPVCHRANAFTFTPTGNFQSSVNLSCMSLDCRWKLEHPQETHTKTQDRNAWTRFAIKCQRATSLLKSRLMQFFYNSTSMRHSDAPCPLSGDANYGTH